MSKFVADLFQTKKWAAHVWYWVKYIVLYALDVHWHLLGVADVIRLVSQSWPG